MNTSHPPTFLLIEPQALLRTTVAGVARDLRGIEVVAAAGVAAGARLLRDRRIDGLLLALDEGDEALGLLERVRAGGFSCRSDLPVAAFAAACDLATAARLKALEVRRVLIKPYRVRQVFETVERLAQGEPGATPLPQPPRPDRAALAA